MKLKSIFDCFFSCQKEGNLKKSCENIALLLSSASISENLRKIVMLSFLSVFGDEFEVKSYAIRSSASGKTKIKYLYFTCSIILIHY